jgi:hypothetical protein
MSVKPFDRARMTPDLLKFKTIPLLVLAGLLSACGGGGGGGGGGDNPATPPATSSQPNTSSAVPALPNNNASLMTCPTVPAVGGGAASTAAALTGRVTFDRIPFFSAPTDIRQVGPGLNYDSPVVTPARGVIVEAVAASGGSCEGAVLDTTVTDGDGWYALNPNLDQNVCVRARAQLYRAGNAGPDWNISVVDNTDGNRLYVMADNRFASARNLARRDLHAASGWSGGVYTEERVAAPFAIADTACKAIDAILSVQPAAKFGDMTFRWSTRNTESSGSLAAGQIGGAFFSSTAQAVYLRGDASTNTDEFDEMVIAHEFGHFVTNRFSRSDSLGGDHSLLDYLDPRLAFDEGWATAFAGLVLNSHIYRDSDQVATVNSPSREFYFFIDDSSVWLNHDDHGGWHSESVVQNVIYSSGESNNNDGVALGFGPIWSTMIGGYKNTPALQTIFSFASALKANNPAAAGGIANLLNNLRISGDSIDPFAQTETHAPDTARDLPVYRSIDTSATRRVCASNRYALYPFAATDSPNKLSMTRFLRFDAPAAGNYRITATPDRSTGLAGLTIFAQGRQIGCASGSSNVESLIAGNAVALSCNLQNTSYVIAVYQTDFSNDSNAQQANYDQCFVVKAEVQ